MIENLNDDLRDLNVRHHVGIQRLSSASVRKLIPILDQADQEIVQELIKRGDALEGSFRSQRLRALLDAIREINRDAHVQLGQGLRQDLRDLASYEVSFQQDLMGDTISTGVDWVSPNADVIRELTTHRPLGSKTLSELLRGLSQSRLSAVTQAIRLGMVQGETTADIVKRVRGTRAKGFRDGAMQTTRLNAEKLVRTAINNISNAARESLFAANDDIVKEVQWVATLDTRTCIRCMALDGKTFKMGVGARPPLHVNCRCTIVPVTKSWQALGFDIPDLPPPIRASMNGAVSRTDTFNAWLKKQTAAIQDEALGPTRGALFRRGRLSVDRFVDVRGNQLTLDELRATEQQAFRRANVE